MLKLTFLISNMIQYFHDGFNWQPLTWVGLIKRKIFIVFLCLQIWTGQKYQKSFQQKQISVFKLMTFQNYELDFLYQGFNWEPFCLRKVNQSKKIGFCSFCRNPVSTKTEKNCRAFRCTSGLKIKFLNYFLINVSIISFVPVEDKEKTSIEFFVVSKTWFSKKSQNILKLLTNLDN